MSTQESIERSLILAEGKTKIIVKQPDNTHNVDIVAKDDITAGDGAKHDLIPHKAEFATRTTCNVFRLLKDCGIPVAFHGQINGRTFTAQFCSMLPYEVVVRREAHGSYIKRMPGLLKGHLFPKLLVELFLKTSGRKWKVHNLPCDDPLMICDENAGEIALYEPSKPIHSQKPFLVLKNDEVFSPTQEPVHLKRMGEFATKVFLILEKAWQLEGRTLVDFKVEFGFSQSGILLLADVIDNDSWRVLENGAYIDKQVYREGGNLDDVAENYRCVSEITGHFRLPTQQIIIWRGSEDDDVGPLKKALDQLYSGSTAEVGQHLKINTVTCSIHKEPVRGLNELHALIQQVPDTVVIAYIGRSNGAGPTLSAATTVPVITVPASFKDFRDDVWSSLRKPSNVPVTTVLEPANAALAALEIMALRNPLLYMCLREKVEKRLVNTIRL